MSENDVFDYSELKKNVTGKKGVLSVGKSWLIRDIYALFLGSGEKKLLVCGDFSADCSESAKSLLKLWQNTDKAFSENTSLQAFKIPFLLQKTKICFIPMPNPDGCELFCHGVSETNPFYSRIVKFAPDKDFSLLRANAKGVDLDLNFPENWMSARRAASSNGINGPALYGYCGDYPESERESAAISYFVRNFSPDCAVVLRKGDRRISGKKELMKGSGSLISGYGNLPFKEEAEKNGGFSLWLREFFNIPVLDLYLPFSDIEKEKNSLLSTVMLSAAVFLK